jgi:hypothetical protein
MDEELYGQMMYGTLPQDTQDFRAVLRGIGQTLANQGSAATNPLTVPQFGAISKMLGLAQGQAQTAIEQTPQKLTESRAMLEQYDPKQPIDPRLLDQFMNLAGFGPAGITAWHGSNKLFSMLDKTLRGTGEGAQVYGTGAGYTGGKRPVGEFYRDKLGSNEERIGNVPIAEYYDQLNRQAAKVGVKQAEDIYAKMDLVERLSLGNTIPQVRDYAKESGYNKNILNWVDKELVPKFSPAGYLYKGDIPDELLPKFLDWDSPISKQSKEVQELAKKYGIGMDDLGGDLVSKVGKGPEGSEIMESAGIKGIKYLDDNSSTAQYGATNYIPFSAKDYKIEEINDIPLEQYFQRGLLDRPMSAKEQARAAWEANPEDKQLLEAYRKLRLGE